MLRMSEICTSTNHAYHERNEEAVYTVTRLMQQDIYIYIYIHEFDVDVDEDGAGDADDDADADAA